MDIAEPLNLFQWQKENVFPISVHYFPFLGFVIVLGSKQSAPLQRIHPYHEPSAHINNLTT